MPFSVPRTPHSLHSPIYPSQSPLSLTQTSERHPTNPPTTARPPGYHPAHAQCNRSPRRTGAPLQ
ncbi:hypothetical protein BKA81DRAFT_4204 [Phyllosticta paracitricarpa]